MMAWKATTCPILLLIFSVSVQAGSAVKQAALAGPVANHPANLLDLVPDSNVECEAALPVAGGYRRALQQQPVNVWHTVQWQPSSGAQTPHTQQQQSEQSKQLPAASSDGIQLLVLSFHCQPIHLQPAASSYRPSHSVIIGCIVLSVLLALMLLYYVLHRLFPHIFCMWQNDSDAGVSFSGVSDGIEVMAVGSAFATKPLGVPRSTLDKIPVVKYHNVCKQGLAQHLTLAERCSAVTLSCTASPRCRRSACIQPGSSPSSTPAATAAADRVLASVSETAVEHKMVIAPSSATAAASDNDAAGVAGQLAQHSTTSSPVTQHGMQKHSTLDGLGWSMLGTATSGRFSRSSSAGGHGSGQYNCGGRRSSCGRSTDDICAICHEEYGSHDDVKPLPCSHYYHPDCINAWLEQHDTCPLCQSRVLV